MKNKNINFALIALAVLVLGFFVYRYFLGNKVPDKVVIGYSQLRISLPIFVAQEQGLFKKQGLNVELAKYPTAQPMQEQLVAGKIDIAGYCALPITFGLMSKTKKELIFLTSLIEDNEHPISKLIVKNGLGIDSIQHLKGKRIGILPTRAYEVWLRLILQGYGLDVDRDKIIIQHVAPDLQKEAINSGSVQALFTNDPMSTLIVSNGIGKEITSEALVPKFTNQSQFYFGSFNISKDYAEKNPVVVKKIAAALDEAILYINTNPKQSLTYISKFVDPKFANLSDKYPIMFYKNTKSTSNEDLQRMMKFYLDAKVLSEPFNIQSAQYQN